MAMKAKHAFGSLADVQSALDSKKIDAYDILFLDGDTEPKIGWIDAKGNFRLVKNETDLSELEAELNAKANAEDVEAKMAEKADVSVVEAGLAEKANTADVESAIDKAATDTITSANAYTDKMVKAAMEEHLTKKYEITDIPDGGLVSYREGEIRILCPEGSVFTKQAVGAGGDPNSYYCTLRTYVFDDNIVGYREHLGEQVDSEILTDLKTDEFGHRYQPTWLPLAIYDESTDAWSYYGKSSSKDRMIGFDYRIDWYDANDVVVASDSIRINLANEDCYFANEPYYVESIKKEIDTKIEEKMAEVEASYEIVEF